jgi:uroporphyrinogen decarboxylase
MNNRDRALAVLRYQKYDRLPLVHFGFLSETLDRWHKEGHLTEDERNRCGDGNPMGDSVAKKLGFDFGWQTMFYTNGLLRPGFESQVVAEFPDGTKHVRNHVGVIEMQAPGAGSIPAEIDHLLKDRASYEQHYRSRLEWCPERVTESSFWHNGQSYRFDKGGLEILKTGQRDRPLGLHCGSLYGNFRNIVGVEGTSYLLIDDEPLFDEILNTIADVCYRNTEYALASGAKFDFAHFWEDICFKNGPLINPAVFAEKVGPHYRRITQLLNRHGIDIISLDCDGCIDKLLPIWLENGVNTMFPIEVGTWDANIGPWRAQYGKKLLAVGGVNKRVFSRDRAAVDAEIERLRPLIALGGYIPCPDHRLPGDNQFELVQYYCDRMRQVAGKG